MDLRDYIYTNLFNPFYAFYFDFSLTLHLLYGLVYDRIMSHWKSSSRLFRTGMLVYIPPFGVFGWWSNNVFCVYSQTLPQLFFRL